MELHAISGLVYNLAVAVQNLYLGHVCAWLCFCMQK